MLYFIIIVVSLLSIIIWNFTNISYINCEYRVQQIKNKYVIQGKKFYQRKFQNIKFPIIGYYGQIHQLGIKYDISYNIIYFDTKEECEQALNWHLKHNICISKGSGEVLYCIGENAWKWNEIPKTLKI